MCHLGEQLQRKWYSVSVIVNGDIDEGEASKAVEANRREPEYMQAKEAFVKHIANCEICRNGWRVKNV